MAEHILALDPGGTTGWAEYIDERWTQGHLGPEEHHKALWSLLESRCGADTVIVCESFEYRNDSRPGLVLVSAEYIGIVKLYARTYNTPLYFQSAAEGKMGQKTFVQKRHLEKLGIYHAGWRHAMDATAHLVRWVIHESIKNDQHQFKTLRQELLLKAWK